MTRTQPAQRSTLRVGLNSVWNDACDLAAIAGAGVTMERLEIDWPQVEPSRGRWTWRPFDRRFVLAARHGITMLPLLMGVPAWAGPTDAIPADPGGFSGFVARVVRRYGPRGTFWHEHRGLPYRPARWFEIWNEPYLPQFSAGGPRAAAYARLFKAAASAGRKASPAARFLVAADTSGLTASGRQLPWVADMYKAVPDLNRYFNGVAVHPYSAPRGPDIYTPGKARSQFRRIEELRRMFVARGAARKPFWITEVGWTTCSATIDGCVSEADQATYIRQVFTAVKTDYSSWVRALFLYNYRDPPASTNPTDREHWFGLIRRNGSPKPAWAVLEAEAR